jgi:hypothetical protein
MTPSFLLLLDVQARIRRLQRIAAWLQRRIDHGGKYERGPNYRRVRNPLPAIQRRVM